MAIKVSLIITTYNWPQALSLVLDSVSQQTTLPNEVIVADDGSGEETTALINQRKASATYPLHHVWQEDNGFQAAKIRNLAIVKATGDYIVFIDGDCILRPDFIAQHIALARSGYFVAGNRGLLTERFSQQILNQPLAINTWSSRQYNGKQLNRAWSLWRLPLGPLRRLTANKWEGVKTCNLAIWKKDLYTVNGLDETFVGWGYEDSELVIRLLRNGIKHLNGRFATTVLHLWHSHNDRSSQEDNLQRLKAMMTSDKQRAIKGLDQYS